MKEQKFLESQGHDELYIEWFKCPDCEDTMIFRNANYCPNCGKNVQALMP